MMMGILADCDDDDGCVDSSCASSAKMDSTTAADFDVMDSTCDVESLSC